MEQQVAEALSNKSYAFDKRPIIEKIYVMTGAEQSNGELETAIRTRGLVYADKSGFLNEATMETPVYRYGKKYTKFKLDFNVFTHSRDSNGKAVEETLDTIAGSLNRADILETRNGFYGLDIYHRT